MPLRMTQPPFFTVVCKRKDLPFIVGRADRVPICRKLRQPIRSNCGLGPKPRCCHDGVALSSLSVGWQGLNPINVPNTIESYPVVCICPQKPQKTFIMPRVDRALNTGI
jgi:hypothetical protein